MWETKRAVLSSWSSPIIVYTGKRPEIILNANPYVASYDPDTGKELWSVECMMGEVGPSPAYDEGMAFAVNQHAILAAIDVDTKEIVWEAYDDLPDAASPVAASGYLFVPTSYGVVSCLDAKTGQVLWQQDGVKWRKWPLYPPKTWSERRQWRVRQMNILFYHDGVVLIGHGDRGRKANLHAFSTQDGSLL